MPRKKTIACNNAALIQCELMFGEKERGGWLHDNEKKNTLEKQWFEEPLIGYRASLEWEKKNNIWGFPSLNHNMIDA